MLFLLTGGNAFRRILQIFHHGRFLRDHGNTADFDIRIIVSDHADRFVFVHIQRCIQLRKTSGFLLKLRFLRERLSKLRFCVFLLLIEAFQLLFCRLDSTLNTAENIVDAGQVASGIRPQRDVMIHLTL